jgi:hypothetical protein
VYERLFIPSSHTQKFYVPKCSVYHIGQLDFVRVVLNENIQRRILRVDETNEQDFISIISGLVKGDILAISN